MRVLYGVFSKRPILCELLWTGPTGTYGCGQRSTYQKIAGQREQKYLLRGTAWTSHQRWQTLESSGSAESAKTVKLRTLSVCPRPPAHTSTTLTPHCITLIHSYRIIYTSETKNLSMSHWRVSMTISFLVESWVWPFSCYCSCITMSLCEEIIKWTMSILICC